MVEATSLDIFDEFEFPNHLHCCLCESSIAGRGLLLHKISTYYTKYLYTFDKSTFNSKMAFSNLKSC